MPRLRNWDRSMALVLKQRTCSPMICSHATCAISGRSLDMPGSRARPTRAAGGEQRRGSATAGNARVRRGMIQLAWRFLLHQKNSALAQWYRQSIAAGKKRKTMIVALARKLLVALWRFVTTGDVPLGVILRRASSCAGRHD